MLKSNITNQHTGQTLNLIVDQSYDHAMDSSAKHKHHDDEIMNSYSQYEKYMNHENSYRSAA